MIIVGDIGNTETKILLINKNNRILKKIHLDTSMINSITIKKSISTFNIKNNPIEKILFCSVVPKTFKIIKLILEKKYMLKCYELKNLNLSRLIKIKVNYKQVGSDRITNAISLLDKKNNFIILDFGTATTFDVLIKDTYAGGVIAPGVRLSLDTLSDKATLIPRISLKKIKNIVGKDTTSAVRSGFFWGYAGLIDNIVNLIKKDTGRTFKVIITGGFSNLFKNSINTKVTHNKDITINGLIKISKLIN